MHSSCLINQLNTVNTKYILKIFQGQSLMPGFRKHADISKKIYPVDTGRKLNVHKTFGRRPGRLLNVLCTFNLRPLSTGHETQSNYGTITHSLFSWNFIKLHSINFFLLLLASWSSSESCLTLYLTRNGC